MLHQGKYQQNEQSCYSSLLSRGEAALGILCPVLGSPAHKECGETGEGYQVGLEPTGHKYKQRLRELVFLNLA